MRLSGRVEAEVSWSQVHAFRLERHSLLKPAARSELVRVTRDVGGLQAQVMSAAEMQLAVRCDCSAGDVRAALWKERALVKTWLMRGTLHLVPSADLPLYSAAMRGSSIKPRNSWLRWVGMSEVEFARLTDEIGEAMDGTPLTREELRAKVGARHPQHVRDLLGSGWGSVLKPVARDGLLCFGPNRGQSVTFVNPRQWLGSWTDIDPEEALTEIARRYLRAFGPANRADFAGWWGAWPGVGGAAWSRLSDDLATVSVGGARAEVLKEDVGPLAAARMDHPVQLLPGFDPYVLGHRRRLHLVESAHSSRVSRTAGWISPVVLVEGRVEGTWSHTVSRGVFKVDVAPFRRLPQPVVGELTRCARRLALANGLRDAEVATGDPA